MGKGDSFRHPNSESGSYSCGVRLSDSGVLRANALSPNDPLYVDGSKSGHSAFSVYTVLFHNNDRDAAIKDAGDKLLTIDGVPYNEIWKANQKQHQNTSKANNVIPLNNATQEPFNFIDGEGWAKATSDVPHAQTFNLTKFSLNGSSSEMKKKILSDTFVLPGIAIFGQATAIYAKPNSGKTLLALHLLIQSIKDGNLKAEDVFYVNADDTYKGLIEKLELAERYGFNMLAPGYNDFKPKDFPLYISSLSASDEARGKVLILDTVKKFTDLMDKRTGSRFMEVAREFVSKGGTLIMLAHVNKHRDGDGKLIFAGTSDIVDDCDCAYYLDEVSSSAHTKSVLFENFKSRGDVDREVGYTYSIAGGQSYIERFNSIKPMDESASIKAKEDLIIAERMNKDRLVINEIIEQLISKPMIKTELLAIVHSNSGASKPKINIVLDAYEGKGSSKQHLWFSVPGDKNSKIYSILKTTTADEYKAVKNG